MTNDKEKSMYRIVETVARCCATETCGGEASMTAADLLGKGKGENVCMARTILVSQLLWAGYTVSTVAALLGRTPCGRCSGGTRTTPPRRGRTGSRCRRRCCCAGT